MPVINAQGDEFDPCQATQHKKSLKPTHASETIMHGSDLARFPTTDVVIEGGSAIKKEREVIHSGHIPIIDGGAIGGVTATHPIGYCNV